MAEGVSVNAPAGQWTEIELADGVTSFRFQNASMSVPVRLAIQGSEPNAGDGLITIAPDPLGHAVTDTFDLGDGDRLWVKPADHSGLAAIVVVIPITPAA